MAPSTPPPPSRELLAALTMASTFCSVMSPWITAIRSCTILAFLNEPTKDERGVRNVRPSSSVFRLLLNQRNSEALIDAAFALVPHYFDDPYFPGVGNVSAAVGLQVQPGYIDGPYFPDVRGEQIDFGANQVGVLLGFLPTEVAYHHVTGCCHLGVDLFLYLLSKLGAHLLQLEVHAGGAGLHIAAGHFCAVVAPDHAAQNVQGGVGAHQQVTAFPVNAPGYSSSDRGRRPFGLMDDFAIRASHPSYLVLNIRSQQFSSIPRLTAATYIEGSTVQHHSLVYHISHRGFELFHIAV